MGKIQKIIIYLYLGNLTENIGKDHNSNIIISNNILMIKIIIKKIYLIYVFFLILLINKI